MGIPALQKRRIGAYIIRQLLTGKKRFPLVLMLEPLFRCNLHCKGCGKINQPKEVLEQMLSVDQCVGAAEECGAPVVTIAGGEPLLHPEITTIIGELIRRKRFVYLCTNGLLVERKITQFSPSPYLTFNIHFDGLAERHDAAVCLDGAFDKATNAIKKLVAAGFRVTTNTTFFKGQTAEDAGRLFDHLSGLGVEAMTVAAGFNYENADDQDSFLGRDGTKRLFREILRKPKKSWTFNHSGMYLDFLAGNREFACTPWGNPTRSLKGWQIPCYLLNDGYAASFKELMEQTNWDTYGVGNDPRCADCMVHCGFEPTAVLETVQHPFQALKVALRGPGR
ncbi:MAG TPA: adenosyl-hopene transferase HpnH [Desulfobulbaceae bacterium]|nr:adenosyl-hopene transferase HpnH [Desulfobulbaceae bacterium]